MSILNKFDQLMSHLNGEDNSMAEEFREALEKVQEESEFLECLKACGVDNWDGYSDAQNMMWPDGEDDEA
jgi:cytochrome c556